jgi:hypothetical protein
MDKQELEQIIAMLTRIQERMTYREDLKETMACQEKMEASLEEEEPASVDMTPDVAHEQEVPKEDAVEMPVGELRKRRRDQRLLAAGRRQKKEERNLDARRRGKQQKFVAARRGTTRCAEAARRKNIAIARNHTWDKIERGSRRLLALRKRRTADVPHGILRGTEIKSWTLWRGRPPPKRKEEQKRSKSRKEGSTGHSRSFRLH